MASPEFDVAIVGYGPVGAMGAYLLADAGLRVVVVERDTEIVDLPRAVNLDGEIVRAFQRLGHMDEITALLQPPRELDELAFTNSKREPYFKTAIPRFGHNGFRETAFFDQPELEAELRRLIERQGKVELRLGQEVVSLVDRDSEVRLGTRDVTTGEEHSLSAAYVIGCDGASSFVREAIGSRWNGLGYDQDWLVVDIVIDEQAPLGEMTMQVCDPARLTTYVCVKDPNRRWEFQLQPGETREEMLRPEKIRGLLDTWLPPEHYTLRRAAVYQFHAATAEHWRDGRVFLAGDAAHQTPPFLGQGLNTGLRDVVNLAWKLPLVLDGTCDDGLLETYAAERDPHAHELVDWAVAIGKLMEALAAQEAGLPPADPDDADQRSGYGQGRSTPPLRGGIITTEQQIDVDGSTGYLLRQPTVQAANGSRFRLDESLGRDFAVVVRSDSELDLSDASRLFLERIGAPIVSLEGLTPVEGDFDSLFQSHAAAVVRPDRYVFGVTDDEWSLDRLLACLEVGLAMRERTLN